MAIFGSMGRRVAEQAQQDMLARLGIGMAAAPKTLNEIGGMLGILPPKPDSGVLAESAQPRPRRGSLWENIQDFASAYNGDGRPNRDRREAEAFGAEVSGLLGATDPKMREAAYAQMQQALARRGALGVDIAPMAGLADSYRQRGLVDDAARSLPPGLQAQARMAPAAGAAHAFDQSSSDIFSGPDGAMFRARKGAGPIEQLQGPQPSYGWETNPGGGIRPTPGGPNDPAYQQKLAYGRTAGQVEATPPEPVSPLGQGEVVAQVLQRARQVGIEGLTPAERQIFDYATTRPEPANPWAFMTGMGSVGGQSGAPVVPQAPSRPPATGGSGARGGVARPQSQADFNALPSGARYIDPDDGQLYEKP